MHGGDREGIFILEQNGFLGERRKRAAARQAEGRTCIPVPVPREHVSGRGRIYGTDKGLYPEHMGLDHGRAEEVRC